MKHARRTITGLVLAVMAGAAMALEEPEFTVLSSVDGIEFRRYDSYLVAETLIAGETDRGAAANRGFRRLFRYISGDNRDQAEIDMTAPVQTTAAAQDKGRKIEMTAPVQQVSGSDGWTVSFVVPRAFTPETVPVPTDPTVVIRSVPARLVAVLTYSGRWTDRNLERHGAELNRRLAALGIAPQGEMISAAYNAPFTLPFMRRNEVLVAVDRVPQ